jgi:hypothetical protein
MFSAIVKSSVHNISDKNECNRHLKCVLNLWSFLVLNSLRVAPWCQDIWELALNMKCVLWLCFILFYFVECILLVNVLIC